MLSDQWRLVCEEPNNGEPGLIEWLEPMTLHAAFAAVADGHQMGWRKFRLYHSESV